MPHILLVDDEVDFARGLSRMIIQSLPDARVSMAHNGLAALALLDETPVDVMLLDLNMPGISGMQLLAELNHRPHPPTVVVLTAYGTVDTAVSALKQGAWDFLTKPVQREELLRSLAKALEHQRLINENQRLRTMVSGAALEQALVGNSPAMCHLRESIMAVAASSYTVLIRGESGTGKELAAEAIHNYSERKGKPFIKLNCPAIPEQLLESELFGHAKGAFTGATSSHKGMFVQAEGGTLMLDEVGDIPLGVQVKLLRVLQDGEVRPVGSSRATRVDTRIIAATNQDLEAKIHAGLFREDLFYRLNVLTVTMPPLRERKEDIPLLAGMFFAQSCEEMGLPHKSLSPEAIATLCLHDWPGNVRELQNFIRRQTVFTATSAADEVNLFSHISGQDNGEDDPSQISTYKEAKNSLIESFTRNYMKEILSRTSGNISEAARLSGLERVSLQKILRRLGMDKSEFRK